MIISANVHAETKMIQNESLKYGLLLGANVNIELIQKAVFIVQGKQDF